MFLIILGLVLFVLLVVVHEYGHFIAARKNGVEVEEFGLGFPPKAKTLTKKNGTEYTLNWLPLGGFVRLKGEHDSATGKGTFGAASFGQKTLIILAGVLMNWLAAAVIFTIIAVIGMPQIVDDQFKVESDAKISQQNVFIAQVAEGSPAERAGLKQFDVIKKVGAETVLTSEDLVQATSSQAGRAVEVVFMRDGEEKALTVELGSDPKSGALGVAPASNTTVRSTWSAPIVGVGTTVQLTAETYKGLAKTIGSLFAGKGSEAANSVTGPVGIFVTLKAFANAGIGFVLFLIGVISLSLAVFNSLPIPALDGGRWFVMALFRVLRRPLSKELEEKIHGTGMLVLLTLVAIITVVDIRRL